MAIKIKDITRGNTRVINMTFFQVDGVTPQNLTGGKVFFVATSDADPVDDSDAAIDKTVTSHTAPTLGQTKVTLTASDTRITPGTYNCGAQAVLADGTVIEDTGKFKVKADFAVSTT